MKIRVVSATRHSEADFWQHAALGRSLQRLRFEASLLPAITYSNTLGLPGIYNAALDAADTDDVLVFVHDDVWLDDWFLAHRILDGLQAFDLIGVAGNVRRAPDQPTWAFSQVRSASDFVIDRGFLSGAVAHGGAASAEVELYGPLPQACELLDGVFLATRAAPLQQYGIRFDEQFDFDFYDMDFCRSCRQHGLRLGTWPIALTHQSAGAFATPRWHAMREKYRLKWAS